MLRDVAYASTTTSPATTGVRRTLPTTPGPLPLPDWRARPGRAYALLPRTHHVVSWWRLAGGVRWWRAITAALHPGGDAAGGHCYSLAFTPVPGRSVSPNPFYWMNSCW